MQIFHEIIIYLTIYMLQNETYYRIEHYKLSNCQFAKNKLDEI